MRNFFYLLFLTLCSISFLPAAQASLKTEYPPVTHPFEWPYTESDLHIPLSHPKIWGNIFHLHLDCKPIKVKTTPATFREYLAIDGMLNLIVCTVDSEPGLKIYKDVNRKNFLSDWELAEKDLIRANRRYQICRIILIPKKFLEDDLPKKEVLDQAALPLVPPTSASFTTPCTPLLPNVAHEETVSTPEVPTAVISHAELPPSPVTPEQLSVTPEAVIAAITTNQADTIAAKKPAKLTKEEAAAKKTKQLAEEEANRKAKQERKEKQEALEAAAKAKKEKPSKNKKKALAEDFDFEAVIKQVNEERAKVEKEKQELAEKQEKEKQEKIRFAAARKHITDLLRKTEFEYNNPTIYVLSDTNDIAEILGYHEATQEEKEQAYTLIMPKWSYFLCNMDRLGELLATGPFTMYIQIGKGENFLLGNLLDAFKSIINHADYHYCPGETCAIQKILSDSVLHLEKKHPLALTFKAHILTRHRCKTGSTCQAGIDIYRKLAQRKDTDPFTFHNIREIIDGLTLVPSLLPGAVGDHSDSARQNDMPDFEKLTHILHDQYNGINLYKNEQFQAEIPTSTIAEIISLPNIEKCSEQSLTAMAATIIKRIPRSEMFFLSELLASYPETHLLKKHLYNAVHKFIEKDHYKLAQPIPLQELVDKVAKKYPTTSKEKIDILVPLCFDSVAYLKDFETLMNLMDTITNGIEPQSQQSKEIQNFMKLANFLPVLYLEK